MYKYRIYSKLKEYAGADKSFHMPGHKGRGDFKSKFKVAPFDITELSYSDNLSSPEDIFLKAQTELAEIVGAKKSFILTDGSTSGVLAMMYALSKCGKSIGNKIIIFRSSHKSVWNACRLFGLEPLPVHGGFKDGVLQPPPPELVEELINKDNSIVGLVATSPDYYGNIPPLKEYSEILKRAGRYLAADGAHGAHLVFEEGRRGHAGLYADVWVDGAHKSLPALTQGALLSANRKELIPHLKDGLQLFATTSPSYPLSASVEYAFKYIANNPRIYQAAKSAAEDFRRKCPFKIYPSDDWTKLAVDFGGAGLNSRRAADMLEKQGIYAETDDGKYILFYLSPMTRQTELKRLLKILRSLTPDGSVDNPCGYTLPYAERKCGYLQAINSEKETVPPELAVGRICAENAGIFPPCIPVVVAGEAVTEGAVEMLKGGRATFGLNGGKITVVKNER